MTPRNEAKVFKKRPSSLLCVYRVSLIFFFSLSEDLKAAFDLLDPENKGQISTNDLLTLLQGLGCTWSQAEFNKMLSAENLAGKQITFDTFVQVFEKAPTLQADSLREAFRAFDPASSNLIPSKYLRRLITQAGDKLTAEEFSAFLGEVNIGSDDNFDYEGQLLP